MVRREQSGSRDSEDTAGEVAKPSRRLRRPSLVGRSLGGCRLDKVLGHGAMGVVYRGVQEALERPVAVKTIRSGAHAEEASRKRFFAEARIVARMNHPNVAQVFDAGYDSEADLAYIVMEYIEGESLQDRFERKGKLPPDEVVELTKGIADGLSMAHSRGLVHRDIKPDNVLLDEYGIPKIVDFGVAKDLRGSSNLTNPGRILGTPIYLSPEACRGRKIDGRADLYSLGVLMFKVLTSEPPFDGEDVYAILLSHVNDRPPRPRSLEPEIPPRLEEIILKLLEKEPHRRFQSGDELIDALDGLSDDTERRRRGSSGRLRGLFGLRREDKPAGDTPPISRARRPGSSDGGLVAPGARELDPVKDEPIIPGTRELHLVKDEPTISVEPAVDVTLDDSADVDSGSVDLPDLKTGSPAAVATGETRAEQLHTPTDPSADQQQDEASAKDHSARIKPADLNLEDLLRRLKDHCLRQDWESAERDLGEALELAPDSGAVHFTAACVYVRLAKHSLAMEHLRRAVALRSQAPSANDLAAMLGPSADLMQLSAFPGFRELLTGTGD
ncbi:protein kinase [Planctomycetota bacterium]